MNNARKKAKAGDISGDGDCKRQAANGFLRLPQVLDLFPVSKSTWWAGVKAGRYPAGVKISARVTAWRAKEVQAMIDGGLGDN